MPIGHGARMHVACSPIGASDAIPSFAIQGRRMHLGVSGDRKALGISLLAHAAVLAALLLSIDVTFPPKPETRTNNTFNVSLQEGDGTEAPIPKASSQVTEKKVEDATVPKPVEQVPDEPVEDARQASEESSSASSEPSTDTAIATPGGGLMAWTPPPPTPFGSGVSADGPTGAEKRIEMPKVDLPKGASEPVLLSYDQGRYSDAASMSEASRLLNTGTITMSVNVDDKGEVSSCMVSATSGSSMLDDRACALVRSYRYRPAQDNLGKPHGAIVSEVLEWARDGKFVDGANSTVPTDAVIRRADPAVPAGQMLNNKPSTRASSK